MQRPELISVLQASFDAGILVNESGKIEFLNKKAQEFIDIRDESPKNLAIHECLSFLDGTNPKSWKNVQRISGDTFSVVVCKQNYSVCCEARLAIIESDTLLFLRPLQDNSAARMVEESMPSQALVESILNAALDPLFQVNEHGVIQMVITAATSQFGWTRDEFIGSDISMIVGPEHASQHDQYMKRYLKTGEARVMGTKRELPAIWKEGSKFIIQLSLVEHQGGGKGHTHQNRVSL